MLQQINGFAPPVRLPSVDPLTRPLTPWRSTIWTTDALKDTEDAESFFSALSVSVVQSPAYASPCKYFWHSSVVSQHVTPPLPAPEPPTYW